MSARTLVDYLESSASRWPNRPAVVDPAGWSVDYGDLNRQATALAAFLSSRGVVRGDRVGVVLPKGVPAVVALFGIMKAGAAYVPVDHSSPADRGRRILADCQVRAVIVDEPALDFVPEGPGTDLAAIVLVGPASAVAAGTTPAVTPFERAVETASAIPLPAGSHTDLAYILYTSGSTGMPKGVMLTHENALSFVDWCSSVFTPDEHDRFSSHAPFHFDLSVLDLYLSIKHGATVYLISEELGKNPRELAGFIARHRLTIWYSTPSILTLLEQFGHLEAQDCSSLRLVLFAGEVFPVKHLRDVQRRWPVPAYYNLYGPTETNVCTFARIPPAIPDAREAPYPIGFACDHCSPLVLDGEDREVTPGEEGLLYMSGPSIFQGYWNRPVENAAAFLDRDGVRWYNTGDVVRWDPADGFIYVGRRDRMVKRRGYRIELGEIERALYLHDRVQEAAVVSMPDAEGGVAIAAFLSVKPDTATPSIIELKSFCASHLPAYMSPDRFLFEPRLPRTSTDKVDYQTLRRRLAPSGPP